MVVVSEKNPDVKLPSVTQSFLRNGVNKEMLFNLIYGSCIKRRKEKSWR